MLMNVGMKVKIMQGEIMVKKENGKVIGVGDRKIFKLLTFMQQRIK